MRPTVEKLLDCVIPFASSGTLGAIHDALGHTVASERRKAMRDASNGMFQDLDKSFIVRVYRNNGTGMALRATKTSLRDYTHASAVIAIALGLQTWNQYSKAVAAPHEYGFHDPKLASGFAFGLHKGVVETIAHFEGVDPDHINPSTVYETLRHTLAAHLSAASHTGTEPMTATTEETKLTFENMDVTEALSVAATLRKKGWGDETIGAEIAKLHGIQESIVIGVKSLMEASASAGTEISAPDELDQLSVDAIAIIQASVQASATVAEAEELGVVASTAPKYNIPDALKNALNAILVSASVPGIDELLKDIDDSHAKIASMEAKMRSMTTSVPMTPVEVEATGELPKGDAKWVKASVVLKDKGIRVPKKYADLFEFDVPCFDWEHAHRDVPQVDPHYRWRFDMLAKLMWGLANNKKPWIWGHTGTGKTTMVEQVCAILNWPFVRINFDSEITRMDLVGRDTLRTDEHGNTVSIFQDGILPQAMSQPTVICNDELDFVRSDIAYVYQRALEDKGLLLTEDGGRLVKPHPLNRMVATANTQGQGDEFGLYQGARVQSQAFLDRFQCWIEVPYLERAAEKKLISDKVPALADDMVQKIVKYVVEHREAFKQAAILKPISPRGVTSMAEAISFFTALHADEGKAVRMALETTVLGSVTHADASKINELIDRTFN